MDKKLNAHALGLAGAVVSALSMLLLGIFGRIGVYEGAVNMMEQWHEFFSLSIGGIIGGMVEGAIISYITLYVFGWFYNRMLK
jgi:hypothetical protein